MTLATDRPDTRTPAAPRSGGPGDTLRRFLKDPDFFDDDEVEDLDAFVRDMIETFDATINEQSIKPL